MNTYSPRFCIVLSLWMRERLSLLGVLCSRYHFGIYIVLIFKWERRIMIAITWRQKWCRYNRIISKLHRSLLIWGLNDYILGILSLFLLFLDFYRWAKVISYNLKPILDDVFGWIWSIRELNIYYLYPCILYHFFIVCPLACSYQQVALIVL
jgi:hypothetical protein